MSDHQPLGSTEQAPTTSPTAYPTAYPPPPPHRAARPRRAGFAALVLSGALLVGGGAGIGGAAAWDAVRGDDTVVNGAGTSTIRVADSGSDGDAAAPSGSVESVADAVLPSVVELDVSGQEGSGSGSGIVLTEDGLILTNDHVASIAEGGGSITVRFDDGSRAEAEILGTDPLTDTALVQAQDVEGLTPATVGQSSELKVGEDVVAIGSPFGLDSTVTSGIVSALDRPVAVGLDGSGESATYPAIQTDAAINPGNSGGALVDMDGNVVGINASIRTAGSSDGSQSGSIGLGFAIPIDEVMPIVEQMRDGETPTHAQLGISVSDAGQAGGAASSDGSGQQGASVAEGAQVQEIGDGSAAGSAGLQDGDVITRVDDRQIEGADSLVATIRSYRPGDTVEVTYLRGEDERTAELTLGSDAAGATS